MAIRLCHQIKFNFLHLPLLLKGGKNRSKAEPDEVKINYLV
jgi:hypothetical protein